MFMICPECRGEIAEGSDICPLCGREIKPENQPGLSSKDGGSTNFPAAGNGAPPPKKSAFTKNDQAQEPGGAWQGSRTGDPGPAIKRKTLLGNFIGFMVFSFLNSPIFNYLQTFVSYERRGLLSIAAMMTPFVGAYLFNNIFLSRAEIEFCRRREEEKNGWQKVSTEFIAYFLTGIICIFVMAGILIILLRPFGNWKP